MKTKGLGQPSWAIGKGSFFITNSLPEVMGFFPSPVPAREQWLFNKTVKKVGSGLA
jgi:hypothetical protein